MPSYPCRPVNFIVGSPVGGGVDIITRIVADKLTASLGQPVTVENVTGTSAMIGSAKAAKSPPDGHTLLMISSQFSVLPSLYLEMPYDTLNDFVPLSQVATAPLILVVPASLPVASVGDLLALAKTTKLKYANVGNGGSPHLAAESFKAAAGIAIEGVLYEGIVPAIDDLLAGKVDLLFASLPSVLSHVKEKRLKGLGVTTATRAHGLPEIPTIAEGPLPGYEYGAWFGALGPAKMPIDIVTRVGTEITQALQLSETRAQLLRIGYEPVGSAPAQFAAFLRAEMARWAQVVKDSRIQAV